MRHGQHNTRAFIPNHSSGAKSLKKCCLSSHSSAASSDRGFDQTSFVSRLCSSLSSVLLLCLATVPIFRYLLRARPNPPPFPSPCRCPMEDPCFLPRYRPRGYQYLLGARSMERPMFSVAFTFPWLSVITRSALYGPSPHAAVR